MSTISGPEGHNRIETPKLSSVDAENEVSFREKIMDMALEIFNQKMFQALSKDKDKSGVKEKCRVILRTNEGKIKEIEGMRLVGHFIFRRYVETYIEETLSSIEVANPRINSNPEFIAELKTYLHADSRMLHSLAMKAPVIAVIKEHFVGENFDDFKLDLAARVEI